MFTNKQPTNVSSETRRIVRKPFLWAQDAVCVRIAAQRICTCSIKYTNIYFLYSILSHFSAVGYGLDWKQASNDLAAVHGTHEITLWKLDFYDCFVNTSFFFFFFNFAFAFWLSVSLAYSFFLSFPLFVALLSLLATHTHSRLFDHI